MMNETFSLGRCKRKILRVRTWKTGFSIKCNRLKRMEKRTLIHWPYDAGVLKEELSVFCDKCKFAEAAAKWHK